MNTTGMEPTCAPAPALRRGPLAAAAAYFISIYNARADLVSEQRGWSRTFALVASDSGERVALRAINGVFHEEEPGGPPPDVIITSDSATLRDVLELRKSPNEPYLFGELTVRGPEADFLRIDYIAAVLCPA